MTEVISVRFRGGCKNYYFNPNGNQVKMGDQVIVETAQGPEFAHCAAGNHQVPDDAVVKPLRSVLRIATDNDKHTAAYNRSREKEAFDVCKKKIQQHKLEMKLVRVECSFDGSKILFFFTADGRVDFRELVKDLASVFRARIELRQIGVRDEAKMIGGLGICGRPFCCAQFMDEFLPVSIKMAKTQNLSLNPTKISGTCGRLMCCLKYEQDAYEDAIKRLPKNDSFVLTPDGTGNVSDIAAGFSFYDCKDGGTIFIGMVGAGNTKKGYPLVGLPTPGDGTDPDFPEGMTGSLKSLPRGQRIEAAITKFCAERTVDEVEAIMNKAGIPNQKAFGPADIEKSAQYAARHDIATWTDSVYGEMKGIGITNKFKKNPAQIVASAPTFGEHSREVLEFLGYTEAQIDDMYAKGVTATMDPRETAIQWHLKDWQFFWRDDQAEKLDL